ncbi:MAG: nitrate- and nitrite sensing domain-containing protein [Pseudonocardiaceae bacterium]
MTAVLSPAADPGAAGSGPEAMRSRWYWRNWPVVVKLTAVLLVPTIVALVAGVLRIVDQAGAAPAYARISQIVRVQQQLSDLIGGLARERDMATVFVAKSRLGDRPGLDLQFRAVDSSVQVVSASAAQVRGLDFTRPPLAALGALGPLRASVTTGFGPVEVVVTEYSDTIDPLVELDSALTRQLDDVAVTNDAAAVHALVAGREQVSRQHAIVSAALYANHLGPGQIEDLRTAAVRLSAEQDAAREALGPAGRANAIAGIGPDAELSRQRLLQLILNRGLVGDPLNISPKDWDQRNAVAVDNIATVEKELRQRIERTAHALLEHVRATAGLNSVILFFALALGVLVGIFVTRALLRPLGVLKRTALDVADRRLPEAMARIRDGELPGTAVEPVPVGTREEIGQVARAFDEVHNQAVRLASEQAQLRANVNDIFVNLSRRTQGLVERQLKLIDRLESGEQDPQQLDNLFQLDHLATRMRRNSENLLVLAGTDATSRSGRPVRLVDVLRAAVSEVEQYQRLVLQQPPAVLVLGRSASDLVHLLAELLDNATQFSPPDSQVIVSSDFAADGSVAIEVADCGVGMTDAELAEANQRLADPPVVDASVSRRMGLFVVGRLAGRHGITVQLRRGESDVGVWACVTMPPRLVRVASETVEPPAAAVSQRAETNGHEPDGHDAQSADQPAANEPQDDSQGAQHSQRAQHIGKQLTSAQPSPAPPGPPANSPAGTPVDVPSAGSDVDLFRPARTTVGGPLGLGHRTTLQHSTPIFDDVASAWFKEHEAVPVRWTAPSARGPAPATWEVPAPGPRLPDPPLPDAPLPDAPLPDPALTKAVASATAGSPSLTRRQPGKTLTESQSGDSPSSDSRTGDAGRPRSSGQPVPALEVTTPAGSSAQDWGAADEGWRAAQALAMPVSAEVTAMGLPRRQPRALLVPGAVGGAGPAASAPVRSAESIRGRLSSYQQGIREGRQARRSLDQQVTWSPPEQQDRKEETK